MMSKHLTIRAQALAILLLTWCAMCSAQTPSEPKGMGQMTGRDDSGADRKTYTLGRYPEDQKPLLGRDALSDWGQKHRVRSFGWLDGGFTSVSNASGLVAEAPTPNRFSNQFMLDAAWVVWNDQRLRLFRGDFGLTSMQAPTQLSSARKTILVQIGTRWGTEFRQAYFKLAHTDSLSGRDRLDRRKDQHSHRCGDDTFPLQPALFPRLFLDA